MSVSCNVEMCSTQIHFLKCTGLDLLNQFGVADCSYDLTPQQLCDKIKDVDALIVRSATKVPRLKDFS